MVLHPEKVQVSVEQHEVTFLGYKLNGVNFTRPSNEWLQRALYPESYVLNRQQSFSRLYALYLLGGCDDPMFSQLYTNFRGYYRIGKFVFDPGKQIYRQLMALGFKLAQVGQAIPRESHLPISLQSMLNGALL